MRRFKLWAGIVIALGCCAIFQGRPIKAQQTFRRLATQAFVTSYTLPNVTVSLVDGQGVPLFTSVDNVQVTGERLAGGLPINVPVAGIESLDPALYFLTVNVFDFHTSGGWTLGDPTPPIKPAKPGTKVWIVVEGIGR